MDSSDDIQSISQLLGSKKSFYQLILNSKITSKCGHLIDTQKLCGLGMTGLGLAYVIPAPKSSLLLCVIIVTMGYS